MPKKTKYIIFICALLMINITVYAAGFSTNQVYTVCGIDKMPKQLPKFTSGIYNVVKILVPIAIIVMGLTDFLSAVSASDEQKMKKCQKRFITRLIAGVFIFFIMGITQFVFNSINFNSKLKNGFTACMDCMLSNNNCGNLKSGGAKETCDQRSMSNCTKDGKDVAGYKCELTKTAYSTTPVCKRKCSNYSAQTCMSTSVSNYCKWDGKKCTKRKTPLTSSNNTLDKVPKVKDTKKNDSKSKDSKSSSEQEKIVEYAKKFVGHPYVWGGNNLCENWVGKPGCGVDCSGFVVQVYLKFGYNCLSRTADAQAKDLGNHDYTSAVNLQKGDLVFFYPGIEHVGIYIGDGKYVHASSQNVGIIISDISNNTPLKWGRVVGNCKKSK